MACTYRNMTSSGVVSANPVALSGVFISSATGATLAIYDDSTTGTSNTVISAFTPNVSFCWYPMPFQLLRGLNCVITGTLTYTAAFR